MPLAPGSTVLEGRYVRLEPLAESHVPASSCSIAQLDGVTVTVFAFDVADDRITRIWAVRNPEKPLPWV